MSEFGGPNVRIFFLSYFRVRVQHGLNGTICSAVLRVYMRAVHYGTILVIAIKSNESYCVPYLCPSNRATEKDADGCSGQPLSIPKSQGFRATELIVCRACKTNNERVQDTRLSDKCHYSLPVG